MRKFIVRIVVFAIPVVLILGFVEFGIRRIPNDYSCKNAWLENNIGSLRIWIVGSSQSLYDINPSFLGERTFNGSHVSQTHRYDKFLIDKFIDKADSLKYIILPITYHSLVSALEDGEEWWRVKSYCIYYDCPFHKYELKYHTELYGLNIVPQVKRLANWVIHNENAVNCDSLGFSTKYSKANRADVDWFNNGAERIGPKVDLDVKAERIVDNKEYLISIASACQRRNVKLLLVSMPVHQSYYELIDSVQYNMTVDFCDSLMHTYDNVAYINLLRDSRFEEDDFFDADHLCVDGAEKLTKILYEYIMSK